MHQDAIMEGLDYSRILSMPVFCGCKRYTIFWICLDRLNNALWQGSEYIWSTLHRVLNKPPVLNMLGHRIWQGCEYARVMQGAEYP